MPSFPPSLRPGPHVCAALTSLVLCTGVACATVPAPHQRMAAAQSSLRAAEEMGAARIPSAALHLQLARDGLREAQKLIDKGQNERAEYVSKRAEADADLSLALAHEAPMRTDAQDAVDRLNSLQGHPVP